jgi:hypothetical protein
MPLMFSPVYSPTRLLQLQSFFIYSSCGEVPHPPLWWSMPHFSLCYKPSPLQAHWGRWCHTCLLWRACFSTVQVWQFPSCILQSSGCPTLFAMCLFFFPAVCLLFSIFFSFFPGQGSVCLGGYADLSQGVPCTA